MSRPLRTVFVLCLPSCASPSQPTELPTATEPVAQADLGEVLSRIQADRRQFEQRHPGVLVARVSPALEAELRHGGLLARSGEDELSLRTAALGRHELAEVTPALGACAPTSEQIGGRCAPAAELRHEGLTEWWTSEARGVRQGWTIDDDPGGDELSLRLDLDGGAVLRVDADGLGATLVSATGGHWRYEELRAWDAAQRALTARMERADDGLHVLVDVSGARWPVTVDPLLGPLLLDEDQLTASDGAAGDALGYSVAFAGDIDGDGYDEVVAGACGDDDAGTDAGRVYLYYGSRGGIDTDTEETLTAAGTSAGQGFGCAVAGAGDLDGDGYDDLIVGAPTDGTGGTDAGAAYAFYGSASGLGGELEILASDAAPGDLFGWSVAGAGDLDGDGYDDVIVGAPDVDDVATDAGAAYAYFGTATGLDLSTETKLTVSGGAADDALGTAVAGLGDLDGDGYDDLGVGAPGDDDAATDGGAVYLWSGGASGLSGGTRLTASTAEASDAFGTSLGGQVDVDDDGYDDIVVGAPGRDSGAGVALVYLGSSSGLSSSSELELSASDAASGDGFGTAVAGAGDLDDDGHDDIAVGAPGLDQADTDAGGVYLYFGSSAGIDTDSEQQVTSWEGASSDAFGSVLAGPGDSDGDGWSEVVVGVPGLDDNGAESGGLSVLEQSREGFGSDTSARDAFGQSVSSAGDIDGDGHDDIIVGAFSANAAYVYYGTPAGVSTASEQILTASDGGGEFGYSVSGGGDLDGDGYDDVVVGAPNNGSSSHGAVYIYYGSASGLVESSEQKLRPTGLTSSTQVGHSVALVQDVDGDGYDDVVAGGHGDVTNGVYAGAAWVWSGSSTGVVESSEKKLVPSAATRNSYFGYTTSTAGDVDGDGYGDVLVGMVGGTGAAYLFYGSSTSLSTSDADRLRASDRTGGDSFGRGLSGGGDINGDGYDDIVIGAPRHDHPTEWEGAAYVYYGSASGISSGSEEEHVGRSWRDAYGTSVALAGDLDQDGYDDVIVGSPQDDDEGLASGSVFVHYGSATGLSAKSRLDIWEVDAGDLLGQGEAVAGAGDIDGDGYADLMAAAPYADRLGITTGAVFVLSGGCRDSDGDGYCTTDDCDDGDSSIHPGATDAPADGEDTDCDGFELCYADADGDGYTSGTVASADTDCTGTGESATESSDEDCDDADASVFPGATEAVADGVDSDCDGTETCYADADGDGWTSGTVSSSDTDCTGSGEAVSESSEDDCDDSDAAIYPGATETTGDEVDSDCDGTEVCYADADDDGYIDGSTTVTSSDTDCSDSGEGTVSDATGECDDDDASIHPGATEGVGDEVDQDCDGAETCYADADDDGYIDGSTTVTSGDTDCTDAGEGLATDPTGECDDSDATIRPGATEGVGDEVDQDCDGAETCYADADDDGYIDGSTTVTSSDTDCTDAGEGLATDPTGECDDSDATIHPGAAEGVGDEVDSDCDGTEVCFADADEDGYTDTAETVDSTDTDCQDAGEGRATDPDGDCDDEDASIHPGATEGVGDEVDQDCDGAELCFMDADDDGYTDSSELLLSGDTDCQDSGEGLAADPDGDCDDSDAAFHPGATEDDCADPNDYNCDGSVAYADEDADGYAACEECDDSDAAVHPSATEICDGGVDNDCDGLTDDQDDSLDTSTGTAFYVDVDGDGFGDAANIVRACEQPEGTVVDPGAAGQFDCDDTDATAYPGATETEDDGIDQDCDGSDAVSSGGGAGGDDGKGSGCSSVPSRGGAVPWLGGLALILGLRRRRRRS
jgi:hypothetical protein